MIFYVGNILTIVKNYGSANHNKINNPLSIELKILNLP